jgi:hypothetical protein
LSGDTRFAGMPNPEICQGDPVQATHAQAVRRNTSGLGSTLS